MKASSITKTLKKKQLQDNKMSLGFRRYLVLPNRVRKNIQLAHFLKTGSTNWHSATVEFFQEMSQEEYLAYLKQA